MKLWTLLSLLLLGAPLAHAEQLRFEHGAYVLNTAWEQGPQTPDESVLRLEWKNASGVPVTAPGEIHVSLFMSGMGHGSAPTTVSPVGNAAVGTYRVNKMYFTMGGKWDVRVQVKFADGSAETESFTVLPSKGHVSDTASPSAFASPALASICASGVTPIPGRVNFWYLDRPRFAVDGNTLYATMNLKPNAQGQYALVRVDATHPEAYVEMARFAEVIRGIQAHDGKIWLLFRNKVVSLDAASGALESEALTTTQAVAEEAASAQAFTWANGKLVIAHGELGMVEYDTATHVMSANNSLSLTDGARQSAAIDVTTLPDGNVAFAVEAETVSNYAPFTFNGLVVMDPLTNSVVGQYPYNRAESGVLNHARVHAVGDSLLINNWGIFQRASLRATMNAGEVTPAWTPIQFAKNGVNQPGELLGDFIVDGSSVLACAKFTYPDPQTGRILHEGAVYSGSL